MLGSSFRVLYLEGRKFDFDGFKSNLGSLPLPFISSLRTSRNRILVGFVELIG